MHISANMLQREVMAFRTMPFKRAKTKIEPGKNNTLSFFLQGLNLRILTSRQVRKTLELPLFKFTINAGYRLNLEITTIVHTRMNSKKRIQINHISTQIPNTKCELCTLISVVPITWQ